MFDRSADSGGSGMRGSRSPGSGGERHPRIARADRVASIRKAELRIEAMVLWDAADWAGQHGVDLDDPFATGPAGGVGKYVGSDGTPWIDEHVAKEYGALRGTSTWEATDLIIDALDLRHRFPRLWRAVRDLQVRVRFARKISKACRDLSREAAAAVDAELARTASWGLPWARLEKILAAAIINADPELHRAKLAAAQFDRRVWLSPTEDGLRTLVIKADQGDQLLLYALIDRIADILLSEGDHDPVDVRRAKAAGWLARPEDLVVLLYRHAGGTPPDDESDRMCADHRAHSEEDNIVVDDKPEPSQRASGGANWSDDAAITGSAESDHHTDQRDLGESPVPEPPPDFPGYDPDPVEPPLDPGASDRLPPPRDRRHGTEHLPGPEPFPPTWCYQSDLGPPGPKLGCDVPRLVDYLTSQGLKPARPRVILTVHLTDQTLLSGEGVVRSDDLGPILLTQLLDLLKDHHCQVSLRPVLDPANLAAADSYEIPDTLRAAVRTRHPASVFPFSSRTGKHLELDHTLPHSRHSGPDQPEGQTRVGNLGPLAHPEHQAKTDGVWHVDQVHPGVFLWRSPHQHYFLVTNRGTQALGPMPTPRPGGLPKRTTIVRLDSGRRQHHQKRSPTQ